MNYKILSNNISIYDIEENFSNEGFSNIIFCFISNKKIKSDYFILNLIKNKNVNFFIAGEESETLEDLIDDLFIENIAVKENNDIAITTTSYNDIDECFLMFFQELYQYGQGLIENASHLIIYDKDYIKLDEILNLLKKYQRPEIIT